MADRVVLIHETPEQTTFSELDVVQADILLQQLEIALQQSVETLRRKASLGVSPVW